MKRLSSLLLLCGMLLAAACVDRPAPATGDGTISTIASAEGDSTLYGLACEGSTDTILVLLSNTAADPDTFNILNATKRHHIFGHPTIGDMLAVVVNPKDSTVADFVVNVDELKGSWCYQVMPTLRARADIDTKSQKKLLQALPDSVVKTYMVAREYGIKLKGDNNVVSIGSQRHAAADEESPVEYPKVKNWREWQLYNGSIIFTESIIDSTGTMVPIGRDTAELVLMERDTLVLRFKNETRGYYRKQ